MSEAHTGLLRPLRVRLGEADPTLSKHSDYRGFDYTSAYRGRFAYTYLNSKTRQAGREVTTIEFEAHIFASSFSEYSLEK
ncbi:hypothetical protein GCM10023184_28180 [Flaviaesturariibacter amylovorans]|uniref:Uncharacterized protein n=1 Tax=Flaviaesturariibacter amylovorans TaxID=1084520 RepID=A0ABP8H5A7_9BACT